jgi:hypothetical protein
MCLSLSNDGAGWVRARALRGGSFINNERNARCAYRNNNDNLNNNNGFRVVASYFSLFAKAKLPNFKTSEVCPRQKCCAFMDVQPRHNRRESAVTSWLGVFLFQQWALKGDWGRRSGEYKRGSRFGRLTVSA